MKNSKKNFVIVLLVVLLLALAVGYAAFADTLTINGTAKVGSGLWSVHFKDASVVGDSNTTGAPNAQINLKSKPAGSDTGADDIATVTIDALEYPGAGANFKATIINDGSVTAVLKKSELVNSVKQGLTIGQGQKYEGKDILVNFPDLPETIILKKQQELILNFNVQWSADSSLSQETAINFTLDLPFKQLVEDQAPFTGVANHLVQNVMQ